MTLASSVSACHCLTVRSSEAGVSDAMRSLPRSVSASALSISRIFVNSSTRRVRSCIHIISLHEGLRSVCVRKGAEGSRYLK